VKKTVRIIAEKLEKIGVKVYKNPEMVIQNIVATSDLEGELNLSEVAMVLGLENVEYEPEQFPGLVYRLKEPKVAMLLFGSGLLSGTIIRDFYKPTSPEIREICQNALKFNNCTRLKTYNLYLRDSKR
jgi:TATA-box binding protein (TBP) (component of TFIID and TFIIIB)